MAGITSSANYRLCVQVYIYTHIHIVCVCVCVCELGGLVIMYVCMYDLYVCMYV